MDGEFGPRSRHAPRTFAVALVTGCVLLALGGCGGGGGEGAELTIADVTVTEGNAGTVTATAVVTLSAAIDRAVTVDFATADGTAAAGSDYQSSAGTLTIPVGDTSANVNVTVLGDTAFEASETLTIALSSADGAALADGVATVTITNDDAAPPGLSGLDSRPSNTSCVAPPRPTGNALVGTQAAFPAAPDFDQPTKILQQPGNAGRWFVLEKTGLVRVFNVANPAGATTYLDFTNRVNTNSEGGLLGMAFDPDFPATPHVYVSYTGDPNAAMVSKIARIVLDNTSAPVNTTEEIILRVNQPFDNHNGGDIAFGADRSLYIGLGDGGSGGDPQDNAQNTTNLLGDMLRIDVLGVPFPVPGYRIPASNPFSANGKCGAGSNAQDCPEIFAWGLRNPWRWSFDRQTGALWAGDVGQGSFEEIDVIVRGGNYGWRCREGASDFNTSGCPAGGFVEPVSQYGRSLGQSVTGGFVYRGTAIPALRGRYVFGDFVSGRIWALKDDGNGGYTNEQLIDTPHQISTFGQGEDGELYYADFAGGRIYRLVPSGAGTPDTIPADLRDTGCVDVANPTQPATGLVPYDLNAPFWSDGATKSRFIALPNGGEIDVRTDNDWDLPTGTVILKNFRIGAQIVETRLLMRHPDGIWAGYTYEWNDAGTSATRVIGGKSRSVAGQTWIYPSEGDCMRCHTSVAGFALGPETAQLNRDFLYTATGRTANQLSTFDAIDMLSAPLAAPPASLPRLAAPSDGAASLDARARAYLHTNCAQCHRPGGPTPTDMDLRYSTVFASTRTCNITPTAGDLGLANARRIAAGDPARSVLLARMSRRDANAMPPLASAQIDTAGVALISAWISSLPACP